jgi:DNA-binding response OmpR family regulator
MGKGIIIVVEDEEDIREVIEYNLSREGFEVVSFADGSDALRAVESRRPALVLLDLMIPGMDGLEVCKRMKGKPSTRSIPIVMVTAKGEESDIVLGLGLGADDYIVKPFSPRELVARVKAVLRRGPLLEDGAGTGIIEHGGLTIDPDKFSVRIDGEPITLTATEFKLLHFLASHPGRVFTRAQLLANVLEDEGFVIDRNIDVHIGVVRKKLGRYRDLIETIRGVGYRFSEGE